MTRRCPVAKLLPHLRRHPGTVFQQNTLWTACFMLRSLRDQPGPQTFPNHTLVGSARRSTQTCRILWVGYSSCGAGHIQWLCNSHTHHNHLHPGSGKRGHILMTWEQQCSVLPDWSVIVLYWSCNTVEWPFTPCMFMSFPPHRLFLFVANTANDVLFDFD